MCDKNYRDEQLLLNGDPNQKDFMDQYKEAKDFFSNYRDHVKSKNKVIICYNNVNKMVQAYEVLEGCIKIYKDKIDLQEEHRLAQFDLLHQKTEELNKYKPSSSIVELCELNFIKDQTPKQINSIFHQLSDKINELTKQNKIYEESVNQDNKENPKRKNNKTPFIVLALLLIFTGVIIFLELKGFL